MIIRCFKKHSLCFQILKTEPENKLREYFFRTHSLTYSLCILVGALSAIETTANASVVTKTKSGLKSDAFIAVCTGHKEEFGRRSPLVATFAFHPGEKSAHYGVKSNAEAQEVIPYQAIVPSLNVALNSDDDALKSVSEASSSFILRISESGTTGLKTLAFYIDSEIDVRPRPVKRKVDIAFASTPAGKFTPALTSFDEVWTTSFPSFPDDAQCEIQYPFSDLQFSWKREQDGSRGALNVALSGDAKVSIGGKVGQLLTRPVRAQTSTELEMRFNEFRVPGFADEEVFWGTGLLQSEIDPLIWSYFDYSFSRAVGSTDFRLPLSNIRGGGSALPLIDQNPALELISVLSQVDGVKVRGLPTPVTAEQVNGH